MYNEEQKSRFIAEYTGSLNTALVAKNLFNLTEKFELLWEADLCTRSTDELQSMVNEVTGLRSNSRWMTLTILKEYVKWCIAMRIPGACDGMLNIRAAGLDKIKKQMVSSPMHLQKYLDDLFEKESEETIDNLFRCYFWMAYSGISEEDAICIERDAVDFRQMSIRYKYTFVPIYREAFPAFHNAVELSSFVYKHPNYSDDIRRDRVPGTTIMRGIKSSTKAFTMRSLIYKRNKNALADGTTDLQLSYHRVSMSGMFYRMYERERAGLPVSFADAVALSMDGKEYRINDEKKLKKIQRVREHYYLEDYQRWKAAFSI